MSYEIELKAHVKNRENVIKQLNSFANYLGKITKEDTYYKIPVKSTSESEKTLSVRIRKEEFIRSNEVSTSTIFTYKRKEKLINSDGTEIEVNQENEFSMDCEDALVIFLEDLGGKKDLFKKKIVEEWTLEIQSELAHIELCTVPPLGDFLEIEVIKDSNNPQIVEKIKKLEEEIFTKCNISLSEIETRYYRDMLKDAENKNI